MTRKRETYLVEQYRPGLGRDELELLAVRVRHVVHRLERAGEGIRVLRTTIVPADESILTVVESCSEELVRKAYADAGAPFERISTAIEQGGHP